jgi:hypothetical protein
VNFQQIIMVLQQIQTASASVTVDQIVEWMMRYTEFNDPGPLPKKRKSVLKLIIPIDPIDPWMPEDRGNLNKSNVDESLECFFAIAR